MKKPKILNLKGQPINETSPQLWTPDEAKHARQEAIATQKAIEKDMQETFTKAILWDRMLSDAKTLSTDEGENQAIFQGILNIMNTYQNELTKTLTKQGNENENKNT